MPPHRPTRHGHCAGVGCIPNGIERDHLGSGESWVNARTAPRLAGTVELKLSSSIRFSTSIQAIPYSQEDALIENCYSENKLKHITTLRLRLRGGIMKITPAGHGIHVREIKGIDRLKKELPPNWFAFTNLDLMLA